MDATPTPLDTEKFIAVVAHDLRNPIAVVRASAQMAERQIKRENPAAALQRLASIVAQTDRLTGMIEVFQDAAQVVAGHMKLTPEHVSVLDVVQQAVESARVWVAEHGDRAVDIQVPPGLSSAWDRARSMRTMRALVQNALIYGDPERAVTLRGEVSANRFVMILTAGGHGPTEEEQSRLFEPFYRGPSAGEAGHAGSGLGLFTARGLARAMGGDVTYAPEIAPDAFTLTLPLSD